MVVAQERRCCEGGVCRLKRSEFLKRGGAVAVLAVVAPKVLVAKAAAPPVVAAGPAATALTVANGSYFRVGDIIRNCASGEAMMVTRVDENTLTVARGFGSLEPKPVKRGDEIMIVAGAQMEDSPLVDLRGWQEDELLPRVSVAV